MRNEPRPAVVTNDASFDRYEWLRNRAIKWLGDRHLLAKPINRKEIQCPPR